MIMREKNRRLFVIDEMFKYIVAGGLAFAADVSVLYALTELFGLHYLLSSTLGFSIGLLISYSLNIKWVFAYRKFQIQTEFPAFVAIVLAGYVINQTVLWLSVEALDAGYLLAKIGATALVLVFNFLAKKILLFSTGAQ